MLELLESHLKASASPETLDAVTKACEWFEQYELPNYQEAYTDLLMSADNTDAGDITTQIHALTQELQYSILQQLSVNTADDFSIQQGNVVLQALSDLEKTEFNDEIVVLCNGDYEPDTALCEILSVVSGQPPEYFYTFIQGIDRALIERIKVLCEKEIAPNTDPQSNRALIERLLRFKNYKDDTVLFIYDMLIDGEHTQLPFEQYFNAMKDRLIELKPAEIATQLFAASIVSSDACSNPRPVISTALAKTYSSADEITPIMTTVESLILKFHAEETSGVKVMS